MVRKKKNSKKAPVKKRAIKKRSSPKRRESRPPAKRQARTTAKKRSASDKKIRAPKARRTSTVNQKKRATKARRVIVPTKKKRAIKKRSSSKRQIVNTFPRWIATPGQKYKGPTQAEYDAMYRAVFRKQRAVAIKKALEEKRAQKRRCEAVSLRTGKRCRRTATIGRFCHQHATNIEKKREREKQEARELNIEEQEQLWKEAVEEIPTDDLFDIVMDRYREIFEDEDLTPQEIYAALKGSPVGE